MKLTWNTILKVFGGVLSSVAIIGLLFKVFSFIQVHDDTARQVERLADTIPYYFNKIDARINSIEQNTENLSLMITDERRSRENLQKSYINYLRNNTQSNEELILYLQDFIFELKKNGSSNLPPMR